MEQLDPEVLNDLRAQLEAERDSLEEDLAEHGRPPQKLGGDWEGASMTEGEEADPTDAADNIEELVTNVPLVAELEKRYREVQTALKKMDKGTYGACSVCGEGIDLDRLEANPAAPTCVEHA